MFAPPRTEVLGLEALATFADGSATTWRPPRNNSLVGSYRDYHWHRYMEDAALRNNDDGWSRLWSHGLAMWLGRRRGRGAEPRTRP